MNLSIVAQKALLAAQNGDFNALGDTYPPRGKTAELLNNGYIQLINTQPIYGSGQLQCTIGNYRLTTKGRNYKP